MAICPTCHETIAVGAWPWCPHGEAKEIAFHGDEIDYIDENLGKTPIRIRSKAERRRLMKERGLVEAVRHVPHPEGPHMNHTVDWSAAADDYTVNYKRELLERAFKQKSGPDEAERPTAIVETTVGRPKYA